MANKEEHLREALHRSPILSQFEEPNTLVLDELVVRQGLARIDVAVLNGKLLGFEIKSQSDSLRRLPRQMEHYNQVFDQMSLVASSCHLEKSINLIPDWWGIVKAPDNRPMQLEVVRKSKPNPHQDPLAIAQFLWRWEALSELEERDMDWGVRSKKRIEICMRLAENLSLEEVKSVVLNRLKERENWRSDS